MIVLPSLKLKSFELPKKKIFCMEKIKFLLWKYRLGFGALNVMVQYRFGRTNWGSVVHEFWFNYLGFVARSRFFRQHTYLNAMQCNSLMVYQMKNTLVKLKLESCTVKIELLIWWLGCHQNTDILFGPNSPCNYLKHQFLMLKSTFSNFR